MFRPLMLFATLIATLVIFVALDLEGVRPKAIIFKEADSAAERWAHRLADQDFRQEPTQAACGIYAACRALQIEEIDASPGRYLTTEFVPQAAGSSPEDLVRLIESAGGRAWPMQNMSKLDLFCLGQPVIANVRSSLASPSYDHWVCVYASGGQLIVLDGYAAPVEQSTAEFLALWSGYGIVVAHRDSPFRPWMAWCPRLAIWLVIGALGVFVYLHRTTPVGKPGRYGLAISASVLGVALVGGWAYGPGLHWNRATRHAIAPWSEETRFPLAPMNDMIAAGQSPDMILISAQPADDYQQGHYPGALNIPFYIAPWRLADVLHGLDRDDPIVTYCWSEHCEWDRILATKLAAQGFTNIRTGAVGYKEYLDARSGKSKHD